MKTDAHREPRKIGSIFRPILDVGELRDHGTFFSLSHGIDNLLWLLEP